MWEIKSNFVGHLRVGELAVEAVQKRAVVGLFQMLCISKYYRRVSVSAIITACLLVCFAANAAEGTSCLKPRIALLGDSMTWIGGDSCQNERGWSYWLKKADIADCIDVYARSGATWTNTSKTTPDTEYYSELLDDKNTIYNQALRLIRNADKDSLASPDFIVIFAGANDAWFCYRRPGIFDVGNLTRLQKYSKDTPPSKVTSLRGSVCLVCDILNDRFPKAGIILITPLEMSKATPEMTEKVAHEILSAGESCGIQVLHASQNVDIRHDVEKVSCRYTSDGVHTNPAGARLLGNYIVDSLKQIIVQVK